MKVAWVLENVDVYPNISTYLSALQGVLKFKDVDNQTFQHVSLHYKACWNNNVDNPGWNTEKHVSPQVEILKYMFQHMFHQGSMA